ncbi:MAG: citrate synthase [Desulfarculus sp.]|nr:MAG: citrate synthase [Desulfarculus sp.]
MGEVAKLILEGKTYELPVVVGSEGEKAIDISALRAKTGYITLDPGFANTGSCQSAITFMDGEKGILRHRGIPVQELAAKSSFVETAFLLINGRLPRREELKRFSQLLNEHSLVHEDLHSFYRLFPRESHPMLILASMVTALRAFYPRLVGLSQSEEINITVTRLLSKLRTMAAMSYKLSLGHRVIYPRPDLSYCANFLNMMFDNPVRPYQLDDELVKALDVFWILHADHEQNCSTAAVRVVGSARVNLYAAVSAGIAALWGPLHGGANQQVIEMLEQIQAGGGEVRPFIARAKDKNDEFRLMGFGHRVYRTYDPRAQIMQDMCHRVLDKLQRQDPLLDIAKRLEEEALKDSYFQDHNLYPNVDFYSGILLRALGIPNNMFTVMFAIGRLPGWIAQWKESAQDPEWRISRPRQVYVGQTETRYVPMEARDGKEGEAAEPQQRPSEPYSAVLPRP